MIEECNRTGESPEAVHRRWNKVARQRVKDDPKGKTWGRCESCEEVTALQRETGLCGPCCFGENATAYGNF